MKFELVPDAEHGGMEIRCPTRLGGARKQTIVNFAFLDTPEYEELYRRSAYLGASNTKPVQQIVSGFAKEFGVRDRRSNRLRPEPEPEQLELAV